LPHYSRVTLIGIRAKMLRKVQRGRHPNEPLFKGITALIAYTEDQETTRAIGECAAGSEHTLSPSLIFLEWQNLLEIEILRFIVSHSKNLQDALDCPLIQSLWQCHRETSHQIEINNRKIDTTDFSLRRVLGYALAHAGKESNRLEEVDAGLIHDPDELYTEYVDPQHDPEWEALVAKLKDIPRSWLMQETGLARSTITALRNGHAHPARQTREKVQRAVQQVDGGRREVQSVAPAPCPSAARAILAV
jgi:hypothetical protein